MVVMRTTWTPATAGANAWSHLVGHHLDGGRGHLEAVADDHGEWTFADLAERSLGAAGAFRSRGVRPGDRVAVLLPDGRDAVAALLGAMALGAIAVPVDPFRPMQAGAIIADCTPRLVVDDPGALGDRDPCPAAAVRARDPALIVYSSGTTGRPKGVVHAHGALSPLGPSFLAGVIGAGPGDRCLAASRTSTALGLFIGLLRPLAAGAAVVLTERPTAGRGTVELAGARGVTVLAGVPHLWAEIAAVVRRAPERARRLRTVRTCISSGDRMPAHLAGDLAGHGLHLIDGLGSSECGDIHLFESGLARGTGLFTGVTPGIETRISEEEPATLWVRSPSAAVAYWGRRDLTRRLRRGAWIRTEDLVVPDGDAVRLIGRADDLFKVGGRLVHPAEIERALHEHPLVAEAAVVGAPHRTGLVRPAAFVVRAPGAPALGLEAELRRHVAGLLAPELAPARITVLPDLPRLAGGKLDRRALAAAAWKES